MARTSSKYPIRVGFVEGPWQGARLGLTLAPGKHQPIAASGAWARDLDADLLRLRDEHGAKTLVTLLTDEELVWARIQRLSEACRSHGIEQLRLPIRDRGVPEDPAALVRLVEQILSRLRAGETVVVHCMGGLGRSGLVAACALVADGRRPSRAIADVRRARRGAIETTAQEGEVGRFVRYWREHRAGHGDPS
jgi:protein-tyrosine phosphatase